MSDGPSVLVSGLGKLAKSTTSAVHCHGLYSGKILCHKNTMIATCKDIEMFVESDIPM